MQLFEPTRPKLILVEGREEELFIPAFLKHLKLPGIETKSFGGKTNLGPFLKGLVRQASFRRRVESLGVVRDADENPAAAWDSVIGAMQRAELQPPEEPGEPGKGRPRTNVLIMPDGVRPGMLEDACLESLRGNPVLECVDKLFECAQELGEPLPKSLPKAKVYAFLATRQNPGRRIGETAGSGVWPFDSPAFQPLQRFLCSL